jgi:hypothetical protein
MALQTLEWAKVVKVRVWFWYADTERKQQLFGHNPALKLANNSIVAK